MSAEVTLDCVCGQGVQQASAVLVSGEYSGGEYGGIFGGWGMDVVDIDLHSLLNLFCKVYNSDRAKITNYTN